MVDIFDFMRCCRRGSIDYEYEPSLGVPAMTSGDQGACEGIRCKAPAEGEEATDPAYMYAASDPYSLDSRPGSEDGLHKFVGQGAVVDGAAGELQFLNQPNHGCRLFMCAFLTVLLVSFIGSVLYLGQFALQSNGMFPWLEMQTSSGSASRQANANSHLDCSGDSASWSDGQRVACCRQLGTSAAAVQAGCPRSYSGNEFNCNTGPAAWDTEQRVWCCVNKNLGCPSSAILSTAAPASAQRLEPATASGAAVAPVSADVRAACNAPCTVEGQRASCWQHLQYAIKKRFGRRPNACSLGISQVNSECPACRSCTPAASLCVTSSTPQASRSGDSGKAFDCISGFADWKRMWSDDKKAWCCRHSSLNLGCAKDTPTRPPPATTSGKPDPATTFLIPYDCLAGFASWRREWSRRKKAWCCEHTQRGCEDAPSPGATPTSAPPSPGPTQGSGPPFKCVADYADWETKWSIIKKAWCCQHKKRGCPPRMTSVPFNCHSGLQSDWSDRKTKWCCRNMGKGCDLPGATGFDCVKGYSNWATGWSDAKKRYCCARVDCRSAE